MTVRTSKQILYGTFYFIIWAAIFSFAYFSYIKPVPSCFDGKLNQNEERVDCGGVCEKVCLPAGVRPIEVGRVLTFRHSPNQVSALFQITNPNQDSAARDLTYTLRVYDASGNLLQSVSGNSFIYASEGKYIFEPNMVLELGSFANIKAEISDVLWIPSAELGSKPNISLSGVNTEVGDGFASVRARILNEDVVVFRRVVIIAILYGKLGQVAGASQTFVENIAPNDSREFSILYPDPPSVDTANTKIFIYGIRL